MEEEISLKEIIVTLWQGRYLIVIITAAAMITALLVTLFLITPLYQTTAHLDLTHYQEKNNGFRYQFNQYNLVPKALQNENAELQEMVKSVTFDEEEGFVEFVVKAEEPEKAIQTANLVGLIIFDHIGKRLQSEKESLMHWLEFFDEEYSKVYVDYFNQHDRDDRTADPSYVYVMEQRGQKLADLHEIKYRLQEIENKEDLPDQYLHLSAPPREPVNMRWQLNTAVAGVLGLMLSVFIVFIRPHFREVITDLKTPGQKEE